MATKEKALKEKEAKKPSNKSNNTVNGTGGTPIHVNTLQVKATCRETEIIYRKSTAQHNQIAFTLNRNTTICYAAKKYHFENYFNIIPDMDLLFEIVYSKRLINLVTVFTCCNTFLTVMQCGDAARKFKSETNQVLKRGIFIGLYFI